MLSLFLMTRSAQILLGLFLMICILMESVTLVLCFYLRRQRGAHLSELLLETAIWIQYAMLAIVLGYAMSMYRVAIISPLPITTWQWAVFVPVTVCAVISALMIRQPWPLLTIVASWMILLVMVGWVPHSQRVLLYIALAFLLLRSMHMAWLRYRGLQQTVSALSIKESIDSLPTGVLLCEADGYVLLANTQMRRLMVHLTGRIQRNGQDFCTLLSKGLVREGCTQKTIEEQMVCCLPDTSVWLFQKVPLWIGHKNYLQVTAVNITERWALMETLQTQQHTLQERSSALKDAMENLHHISHEREVEKAKFRVHDVLGQRLSILVRAMQEEKTLDAALLEKLSDTLLEDIKKAADQPSPMEALQNMQETFLPIGVQIDFQGVLPSPDAGGYMIIDVIREAVSNAVRHGYATQVSLRGGQCDNGYELEITNDGQTPTSVIAEGSGISSMRKQLADFGGRLKVISEPEFKLIIYLPEVG